MEITHLGHACFRIKTKSATVVCDPYTPEQVGLSLPRKLTGDIVTVSHDHFDHNHVAGVAGTPVVLRNPGEYEISGVELAGVATYHDTKAGQERGSNTVFSIQAEDSTVVHLGDLGHKLTESQVEQLSSCDILLVPVGGTYTIDAHVAAEVVGQLEPLIVVPMHYRQKGLNDQLANALEGVDAFFKEMGKEPTFPQDKLTVSGSSLPEEMQIILLE